jgi:hypothetical protein
VHAATQQQFGFRVAPAVGDHHTPGHLV